MPINRDTFMLKEVIIKEVKVPQKDISLTPMQSLSSKELFKIPSSSVADGIKAFSGVTIKDYGGVGGLKTIMVRSFGANHTGVFVDGVPLSDVATGQIDLGKISVDNIEDISLFLGQPINICQPARYYASASVICINSSIPNFSEKPISIKANLKMGSFGLINSSLFVKQKINLQNSCDFAINYMQSDGKYPFYIENGATNKTKYFRENSYIKSINADLGFVNYSKDSSSILKFKTYYYESDRGLPGAVVLYNSFASQSLQDENFFTSVQFAKKWINGFNAVSNIKYSNSYLHYRDPDYYNEDGKLNNYYTQNELYLSQAISKKIIDSLHCSFASDFFLNTLDANLYKYAEPTRYSYLNSLALKFNRYFFETYASLLSSIINEKTVNGESAKPANIITPSFALSIRPLKKSNIRLRFMYKNIFRMPTFNDLYYNLVGNNELKPEYAKQYNLGLLFNHKVKRTLYFSFKIDAFVNKVENKIIAVPTKNLFVWSMQNIGLVDVNGLDFQFQTIYETFDKISMSLACNYSFQNAFDITNSKSTTYKKQIPYIPFETFSGLFSFSYKHLSFGYNNLFNGFRYCLGENIYENLIHSSWIRDASLSYELKINKIKCNFKIEISNIFDKQYEVIKSFPMPGRTTNICIGINY
ncbi:MAG: hypothetical protein A2X12_02800 [Bacteroidetes bacterium GWE2_29_8]|nr:MAG: hypothetical protein A2X12_02800 [Bacteroidetes bacterium GWE2_29_8]OFY20103.1 MAG: hypothetical protein A2X02_06995 [Bacteroidetes bacterium GWF2_29_10]